MCDQHGRKRLRNHHRPSCRNATETNTPAKSKWPVSEDWPFALFSILDDYLAIRLTFMFFDDHLLTWLLSLLNDRGTISVVIPVAFTDGNTGTHCPTPTPTPTSSALAG